MPTTRPSLAKSRETRNRPDSLPERTGGFLSGRVRYFVLFGVLIMTASVLGTGWLLHSQATGNQGEVGDNPASSELQVVVGFGHVDVESRITSLYPIQPGRVIDVKVKENDPVKKDAILFSLDRELAQINVDEAKKDLDAAVKKYESAKSLPEQHAILIEQQERLVEARKIAKKKAEIALEKVDRLFNIKQTSEEEKRAAEELVKEADQLMKVEEKKLEALRVQTPNVQREVALARDNKEAKETQLHKAEYLLRERDVRAPKDGTVLRLQVGVGDFLGLNPREPVVLFCPDEKRIIRAEVEQEFAAHVFVGQSAAISDDARHSGEWRGKVKSVSDWYTQRRSLLLEPRQFNDVRTLECIIEIEQDPKQPPLRIGQRVRVTFGK